MDRTPAAVGLTRYAARMGGRATPFGLFAGVGVGHADRETRIEPATRHRRHTRLDHGYLVALCAAAGADVPLVANSSLYRIGPRWRYAERTRGGLVLVSVEATPFIDAVLARAVEPATRAELRAVLAADPELADEDPAAIDAFLDELVQTQLLAPAIEPLLTGEDPAAAILAHLPPAAAALLASALRDLAAFDRAGTVDLAAYHELAARLAPLAPPNLAALVQVDLHLELVQATLSRRVLDDVARGLTALRSIAAPTHHADRWARFRAAFEARYETREVPLIEVLDEESGIGFGDAALDTAQAPLLRGLLAHPAPPEPAWTARDRALLQLLARGGTELVLSDADLAALAAVSPPPPLIPATQSAIVRLAAAGDEHRIRITATAGSAVPLLARFCHGSPAIRALTAELVAHEQAVEPGVLHAELVHLPAPRDGNLVARPVLRDYEIAYLGASGAPRERQLPITDLLVSVAGGRVVLRSRRHDKPVRVFLSSAADAEHGLPLVRFLAAFAAQGARPISWSWGALVDASVLPRVAWRRLVFAPAQWRLTAAELGACDAAAIARVRTARGLPRWIVHGHVESELPIDLDNPADVASFAQLARGPGPVLVRELWPVPDDSAVRNAAGTFAHELVIPFLRTTPEPVRPVRRAGEPVRRRFPPGSEWLYAKLYSGEATADAVLRSVVAPLAGDGCFFLRYDDPDPHIRVRWPGDPARLTGELLPRLHQLVASEGLVWRMQLDTYEREVERYGGTARAIELAERLFAADSRAVLALVTDENDDLERRWRLAVCGIDRLLADLRLSLPQRFELVTRTRDVLGPEVALDTSLMRQLGTRFRYYRDELEAVLADPPRAFEERSTAIAAFAGELDVTQDLARSFVHMHVNRMIPTQQRFHELVLCDLLRRFYASVLNRP